MWALIDNYDSFTYILHHYLLQAGGECRVFRNDEVTVDELKKINPSRIIISPGPETPLQAGISMDVIDAFYTTTPILGVCLGHQALGMYFGAKLAHAAYPMHGKISWVKHEQHSLFNGLSDPFEVMRYHSLVIEEIEGTGLKNIAYATDDKSCMAVVHEKYPCVGVQFHPESVGTKQGLQLLTNWAGLYP